MTQGPAALVLELDHASLCHFETGYRLPGSKVALRIEEKTRGKVPAKSWAKTARGKA
jgi:hypothetical protein